MKNIMTLAAVVLAMAAFPVSGAETEKIFSYAPDGSTPYIWGTKKKETYDVAIKITDQSLIGARIKGFKVPIATNEGISDVSGWISTELKLNDAHKNSPDVATVAATINPTCAYDMPEIEVVFNEPYTITENGAYVGYSFTVDNIIDDNSRYPVIITYGEAENGFYLHSSRTYLSWINMVPDLGGISMMSVDLEGEFHENAAGVSDMRTVYTTPDTECTATVTIANHGELPVKSVDYTYSTGETSAAAHFEFEEELAAQLGATADIALPVKAPSQTGKYDIDITITKVNGQPNDDSYRTTTGKMNVYAFLPVTRPLMEEYTGTWCMYCPRGFVALERMKQLYPERFIALAYHRDSGDPMQCLLEFPQYPTDFPYSYLSRGSKGIDPYFGTYNTDLGIRYDWEKLASEFAIADVDVDVTWEDEEHLILKATSNVRFVEDHANAGYRVSYVLVGDDLTGEEWANDEQLAWYQINGYSGNTSMTGDEWKVFTEGGPVVYGLTFNDVVLKYDNQNGVEGSLPAEIKANETYSHSCTFDVSAVTSVYGYHIVNDPSKVRVVAIITDATTGEFINCNSSHYPASAGIVSTETDSTATVVETRWYDLQGRPVAIPSDGIYLRATVMSDGSIRHSKVSF